MMVELNFTEYANITGVYNASSLQLSGTVNGTMPLNAVLEGQISTITYIPSMQEMFSLIVVNTVCAIVCTVCLIALVIASVQQGGKL